MPKPKAKLTTKQQHEQLGQMLVNIYETGYLDKRQTYKNSFIKGVLAGLGGVIGATVVLALVLWGLSLFNEVPLIGKITHSINQTIQQDQK